MRAVAHVDVEEGRGMARIPPGDDLDLAGAVHGPFCPVLADGERTTCEPGRNVS